MKHWLCERNSHAWRPHYVWNTYDGGFFGLIAIVITMKPGGWTATEDRCKRCGKRREHVERSVAHEWD